MAAGSASPSSSPRLPSPPPFTEVQIGPKSPTVGESLGSAGEKLLTLSPATEKGAVRRIRPGTKAADMASGPPLIPLSQLDSPFQLQEHLKALYHHYTKPANSRTVVPITHGIARYLAEPPEGVERSLWLYELGRFLTMKVNNLIVAFFAEDPPCSAQTCPEMRASEWQYLCAVHDPPKLCCAIDYCCHTLDWASNILTSPKSFPSRLILGSEAGGGPQASIRHLTNIFRRLYRIFAHAWFQHREVFWQVEGHDGLYVFFKTVCDIYHLIPEDNYTIPAEAEGPESQTESENDTAEEGRRVSILRKEASPAQHNIGDSKTSSTSMGATTGRHNHDSPVASSVSTIVEGIEDNEHRVEQSESGEIASPESSESNTPAPENSLAVLAKEAPQPDQQETPNIAIDEGLPAFVEPPAQEEKIEEKPEEKPTEAESPATPVMPQSTNNDGSSMEAGPTDIRTTLVIDELASGKAEATLHPEA